MTSRRVGPSGTQLIGLGVVLASALVVPLLIGIGADALFHSSHIGAVIGLFFGVAATIAVAVSQFRRYL